MRIIAIIFGVSGTFPSRFIGQHLSDAQRDIATLSFNLRGHGALALVDDADAGFRDPLYTPFV